jgi:cyclic beta-1,2-glucan synthetase
VLDEPHGSVLRDACLAALREQMAFAQAHGVPWGISESAYAGSDHTLAYQYAPQGVPRLALRRTPPDELVIAPYATALAAQVAPHRACAELRRAAGAGRARGATASSRRWTSRPRARPAAALHAGAAPSWRTTRA